MVLFPRPFSQVTLQEAQNVMIRQCQTIRDIKIKKNENW